jgi:hypothetical protein
MTRDWQTYLKAEYARCAYKLSQALALCPGDGHNEDEVVDLRAVAERLLCEQDPDAEKPFGEADYDVGICIQWR